MSLALDTTYDETTNLLVARWSDDDGTSFRPFVTALLGRADKLDRCRKWLVDLRRTASPSASELDWFYRSLLPQIAHEKPELGLLRVALHITPALQHLAEQLPVESFQNQHGYRVAVFTNEADARHWVTGTTGTV